MKKLIILALCLLSQPVYSAADYSLSGIFRSYPLAAQAAFKAGYSLKFWGQDSGVLYGMIRPGIELRSSGMVNTGVAKLEVYPISFLGFYAAKDKTSRDLDKLGTFNCDTEVACNDSNIQRDIVGVKTALKFAGVTLFTDHHWTSIKFSNDNAIHADERTSLFANKEDTVYSSTTVLGYDVASNLMMGVFYQYNRVKDLRAHTYMATLMAKYKFNEDHGMTLLPGYFHDRNGHNHATIAVSYKWTLEKGLQLF